jgi:hypothetical protein
MKPDSITLCGRLRMNLSTGPRFRSDVHWRYCGDGDMPRGPEQLCWPLNIYVGHWIDGQILADGGTLGKRKPWDSGKFGWSRFDQDVVGVRRWRVRCGLPTIRELCDENRVSVTNPLWAKDPIRLATRLGQATRRPRSRAIPWLRAVARRTGIRCRREPPTESG